VFTRVHPLQQAQLDARSRALVAAGGAATSRQFELAISRYLDTYLQSDRCFFIFVPAGTTTPSFFPDREKSGGHRRKFRDGLSDDFWYQQGRPEPGEMLIVRHSDHTPVGILRQTAFYREHLQPHCLLYGASLVFWQSGTFLGCLTLLRRERRGEYRDDEMANLRLIYFGALQPLVRNFALRQRQEHSLAALRQTIYLSHEPLVVVTSPDEVIAGSKPALRILQSWPSNGNLSHKLPRGRITLPGSIRKWAATQEAESASLHPRWALQLRALPPNDGQTKPSYFLLRLTTKNKNEPQRSWQELTSAERELVGGIVQGHSNRQIATARGVAPATVKNQLSHLLRRLRLKNRTALAVHFHNSVRNGA
jgi:DNA-binding CsgD family transcriptional regulator